MPREAMRFVSRDKSAKVETPGPADPRSLDRAAMAPRATDLLLLGHSHLFSMGVPHCMEGPPELLLLKDGEPRVFTVTEGWNGGRKSDYWEAAAVHGAGRTVALSWHGNQHLARFLIAPDPVFDFVCPGAVRGTQIHPGALVLPATVLRAYFGWSMHQLRPTLRMLKSRGAGRVLLIGTPAPKADDAFLLQRIREPGYFRKMADDVGIDLSQCQLTPATIRQKLWALIQTMMADAAAEEGVAFVPVPRDSLDDDGFLKAEYWSNDATHANAAYGLRFCKLLEQMSLVEQA